jgi:hypothetical protein
VVLQLPETIDQSMNREAVTTQFLFCQEYASHGIADCADACSTHECHLGSQELALSVLDLSTEGRMSKQPATGIVVMAMG